MPSLISPNVEVTIIDESFYVPGRATTVPLIFIATADEKTQADGVTPALGTYEYGVVREVTSIRQSLELYGVPRFIESASGEPHHGDARNEYGLDALNKFLEIGNRAIVVRANVNLDDSYDNVKTQWTNSVTDSADYLNQLVADFIEEFNVTNGLVPADPAFKETVTAAELKSLIPEAFSDTFQKYSFSSREFEEGYVQDHTVDQPGYQEVLFDTSRGFLQGTDVTGLQNDSTLYGADVEVVSGAGTVTYNLYFQGSTVQTFSALLTQMNSVFGGEATAELIAGNLRITSTLDGVTSEVDILADGPSGYLPLFSNLSLYQSVDAAVAGKGAAPLVVYNDAFDTAVSTYDGLDALIDGWTTGSITADEFTPAESEGLVIAAAADFDNTKEFLNSTSLGSNDAARRAEIVERLQAVVNDPNTGVRGERYVYNLVLAPGYFEVTDELLRLSQDIYEEVFVIGDVPFDKPPVGPNSIVNWASSTARVTSYSTAYYYGHGISSNIDGTNIMTTSASTALRVYAFNDLVGEQWFAPAGTTRGLCPHLTNVGYVTGALGGPTTFVEEYLDTGTRDSLYEEPKQINPIPFIEGEGILVLGQKTTNPNTSALDRVNVSRLVKFIKRELRKALFAYLFEPNDRYTRANVKSTVDSFLVSLVDRRGLYDFATVCDESNNTPDRIDRNELWIDIAIKPVKAVEFIYVPIRVVATGAEIGGRDDVSF
jgi:hypothetical protein